MSLPVAFCFAAAGTLSYTVPQDCFLIGGQASKTGTGSFIVTTDPAVTAAAINTPSLSHLRYEVYLWIEQNIPRPGDIRVPLLSGTMIYVIASVSGMAILYFEGLPPL